jgi:hypothetical protein
MSRLPGAGISPADQNEVHKFLVYHADARSGKLPAAPVAAPPGPASITATPASAPVVATDEGLRIEVTTREPQSVRRSRDGQSTTEAPPSDATLYLVVQVKAAESGEKLPYATVSARLSTARGASQPLAPAMGPEGFHYGANLAAPPGPLQVEITIEPPAVAQVGSATALLSRPVTVKLDLVRP